MRKQAVSPMVPLAKMGRALRAACDCERALILQFPRVLAHRSSTHQGERKYRQLAASGLFPCRRSWASSPTVRSPSLPGNLLATERAFPRHTAEPEKARAVRLESCREAAAVETLQRPVPRDPVRRLYPSGCSLLD